MTTRDWLVSILSAVALFLLGLGIYYFPITALVVLAVAAVSIFVLLALALLPPLEIEEGKAVNFKCLGLFLCTIMTFEDRHFVANGFIVDGEGPKRWGKWWSVFLVWRIGGTVFYVRPFARPMRYEDYNDPDQFGQGVFVNLNDITSDLLVPQAETLDGVPVNVKFTETEKVVNPYLRMVRSPRNVRAKVIKREQAGLRAWVYKGNESHTQRARGNGDLLWEELHECPPQHPNGLNCGPVFQYFRENWGIEVVKGGILVEDVGYDNEYQEAKKSKQQQTLLAEGKVAQVAAIDKAMDQWVAKQAGDLGLSVKTTLKRLKEDGSWQRQRDAYMAQILAPQADVLLVGNPDGTPMSGDLGPLAAVAALFGNRGRNPKGKNPSNPGGKGGNPANDSAEAAERYFKRHGKYPNWDPQKRSPHD